MKLSYEQVLNHPELSEAGRKFYSDYHSDGPYFNYEKGLQVGAPASPEDHADMKNLTPGDIDWGIKNQKTNLPLTIISKIFRHHPGIPSSTISSMLENLPRQQLVHSALRNPNFSNENLSQVIKNQDLMDVIDPDILASAFYKNYEDKIPKQGLPQDVLDYALQSNDPKLMVPVLKSGDIPYDKARSFLDHSNYEVRDAILSHPDIPEEDLPSLFEHNPNLFYQHKKTPDFIRKNPQIQDRIDLEDYGLSRIRADNPLSHEEVDHFLTHSKTPSTRDLRAALENTGGDVFTNLIKKHAEKMSKANLPVDEEGWTPDHTKAYFDAVKNGFVSSNQSDHHPFIEQPRDIEALANKPFPGMNDEIIEMAKKYAADPQFKQPGSINRKKMMSLVEHAFDTKARLEEGEEDHAKTVGQLRHFTDAEEPNSHLTRQILNTKAFENLKEDHPDVREYVKSLIDKNPNDETIAGSAIQKVHSDDIQQYLDHPSDTVKKFAGERVEPLGIYPKNRMVNVAFDTGKLRLARDVVQELGGKAHKKELEKRGLSPAALKIAHLQDSSGNLTSEGIQKHIDDMPHFGYGFSSGMWHGGQQHSSEPSKVFQLQMTKDHIKKLKEEGLWDVFKYIEEQSLYHNHPNAKHNPLGWVRYTEDDGTPKKKEEEKPKEKLVLNKPGHPNHGATVSIHSQMPHPQDGRPGFAVAFDSPIHMAAGEGEPEEARPAGTMAWIGEHEIGDDKHWNKPAPVAPQQPQEEVKKTPGVMIDEVQSDFGQALGRSSEAFARYKLRINTDPEKLTESEKARIKQYAQEYEAKAPPEKREKIANILFEGRHSNEVLHEAFHQHLRDKGMAGAKVAIWQLVPKMGISLTSQDLEKVPVHFRENYDKLPKRMGYTPAKYSEQNMPTQSAQKHQNKDTHQQILRKMEELRSRIRNFSKRSDV